MICMCGCGQILTACNHVGCKTSLAMLKEMDARVTSGDSDDLILQSFVQEYGEKVMAEPLRMALMPWLGDPGHCLHTRIGFSGAGDSSLAPDPENGHGLGTTGFAGNAGARAERLIGRPRTEMPVALSTFLEFPGGSDALALLACLALTGAMLSVSFLISRSRGFGRSSHAWTNCLNAATLCATIARQFEYRGKICGARLRADEADA